MNNLSQVLSSLPAEAANRLLGCYLIRGADKQQIVCKIVETEAYSQDDEASHSYRGPTPRNQVMFGPAGWLYVYFTYGMHHCMNVVTGPAGYGAAALIRALEPIEGLDIIKANRQKISSEFMFTNGPGKVCQALAIGRGFNGHNLTKPPIKLILKEEVKPSDIIRTTRIGISSATDINWRFFIKNNPYVSKPWRYSIL